MYYCEMMTLGQSFLERPFSRNGDYKLSFLESVPSSQKVLCNHPSYPISTYRWRIPPDEQNTSVSQVNILKYPAIAIFHTRYNNHQLRGHAQTILMERLTSL